MKYMRKFKSINENMDDTWKQLVDIYSKYGTYNFTITDNKKSRDEKFYIKFTMDMDKTINDINKNNGSFYLSINLIPIDINNTEMNLKDDGTIDAGYILINYEKTHEVKITSLKYKPSEYSITPDRRTERVMKKTSTDIFTNDSNYPSGDSKYNNIFEEIDAVITTENNYGGMYGFYPELLSELFTDLRNNVLASLFYKQNIDRKLTKKEFSNESNFITSYS